MKRIHPPTAGRLGTSSTWGIPGSLLVVLAALVGCAATAGAAPAGRSPPTGQPPATGRRTDVQQADPSALPGNSAGPLVRGESTQDHQAALQAEKQFAQEVMARCRLNMALTETPHFVIWTTLRPEWHKTIASQCEAMYASLLKIFQLPADQPVFLGKCGVFVLSNQEQFKNFCRYAQQIPPDRAEHAIAFQVALPDRRSRIIAFWPGNPQELAETLVHEGSHAFLQRYGEDTHVIAWFNEGLAEHVVGLVFRRQCTQGREAMQSAMDLARRDPQALTKLLAMDTELPAEYYPLAQSVVAFLVQADAPAFAKMIQGLKNTEPFPQVLRKTYKAGVPDLDARWRTWLQRTTQSGRTAY